MAIHPDVLLQLTQGVYLLGTRSDAGWAGSVVDAVMPVATQPFVIGISCMNTSFTKEQIEKSGRLSLSVLPSDVPPSVCETFGYHSGRDTPKWETVDKIEKDGLPVYKKATAYLIATVRQKQVFDSHTFFLARVTEADFLSDAAAKPLSYADYRARIRPQISAACPPKTDKWVCTVCGYIYDGNVPFEELPDDWVCPVCGVGKSLFERIC